ncbi:SapC family protein [Gayadomonas joobiniege]|uniref:SapC family protein n=1 Tax=Gayadomonas joobiniege TaxID=1234606 RepID=UPI00037F12E7|nr:SapC family protein [Gayadomonas joobiniege]
MFKKLVPINSSQHKDIKLKRAQNYNFAQKVHVAPLLAHEFPQASSSFPVIFHKNEESGEYSALALLGLEKEKNLLVKDGYWSATYVPASIRRYPFAAASVNGDEGNMVVCLDEEAEMFNTDEGEALFNDDGSEGEVLTQVKEFMNSFVEREAASRAFVKYLSEKELFQARTVGYTNEQGERVNIGSFHALDEEKFNKLSDEEFLEMRKRGYLPVIYAVLTSMQQMDTLFRLQRQGA